MKYVFIEKHQAEFSIKAMCRVLQVKIKPRSAGAKQTSAFQFSIPFCDVGPCRIQT